MKKLFITSGISFLIALICIAAAAGIASTDLAANGWNWTISESSHGNAHFRRTVRSEAEPDVTRTLTWTGTDTLAVDIPVEVVYTQGPLSSVTVSGPKSMAERVEIVDGRVQLSGSGDVNTEVHFSWTMDGFSVRSTEDDLKIVITAPSVTRFEIDGPASLTIHSYDQDKMTVDLAGSGRIEATGRTNELSLNVSGSGQADLNDLLTRDATVSLSGSGMATISPTGKADVAVSGSGTVDLQSHPATLNTTISGSGTVNSL